MFIKNDDSIFTVILMYVDDTIIASNDKCVVDHLKFSLSKRFTLKDLGDLRFFLGLEISKSNRGIVVTQR